MGGLIGGLYSTGHSPAAMQELMQGIDWNSVLKGQIPFEDLTYRRKQDDRDYPNSLEFGLRHGVQFPAGFNSGHQVGLILDRVALPYSNIQSFNDLPIPFRCVATDLVTSSPHVFDSGSLSLALRSTMSLPGLFSPVRVDDHIFVDGGLLDNLPVDVAKDMGADFIISVYLQTKPLDPKEQLSSFGVLGRSISTVVAFNERQSIKNTDVLINVDLNAFSGTDYEKGVAIAQKGYEAAQSMASRLMELSVDDATWEQYVAERKTRQRTSPVPQFLQVTGTEPILAKQIHKELAEDVGKPVDPDTLDNQLTRLAGVGRYSSLGYTMTEQNGQPGLEVIAKEINYGPPIVRPLIYVDGSQPNDATFSLGARITFLDVGGFGTEWRNDFTLGSKREVSSEYFHPLGEAQHWFISPQGFVGENFLPLYSNNIIIAQYQDQLFGGAFDVGYQFGRTSQLRVGYEAAHRKVFPEIGSAADLPSVDGRLGATRLRYTLIDTDDPVIPRNGVNLDFRTKWFDTAPGATEAFPLAENQMTVFKRISQPSSILFSAYGGTTFGHDHVGVPVFSLGGTRGLAAYGTNELLMNQYFYFKAGYLRQLARLPALIGDSLYFYSSYEIAKIYGQPTAPSLPMDGVGAVVVNTFIGPILFGGSVGGSDHHKIFFQIGRLF